MKSNSQTSILFGNLNNSSLDSVIDMNDNSAYSSSKNRMPLGSPSSFSGSGSSSMFASNKHLQQLSPITTSSSTVKRNTGSKSRPPLSSILDDRSSAIYAYHPNQDNEQTSNQDKEQREVLGERGNPLKSSPVVSSLNLMVPAVDRLESAWSSWVVVFGYSSDRDGGGIHQVLQRFQQFGEIIQFVSGSGNWLFLKYASPVQADRASMQQSIFLTSNTLLAVQRMTSSLSRSMNVRLSRDGDKLLTDNNNNNNNNTSSSVSVDLDVVGLTDVGKQGRAYMDRFLATNNNNNNGSINVNNLTSREDIYLKPSRRKSICEQVMQYFFSYKID